MAVINGAASPNAILARVHGGFKRMLTVSFKFFSNINFVERSALSRSCGSCNQSL